MRLRTISPPVSASRNTLMPEHLNPALDRETIRRMATEELLLALTPAEIEALHPLLNSLLGGDSPGLAA